MHNKTLKPNDKLYVKGEWIEPDTHGCWDDGAAVAAIFRQRWSI